MVKSSERRGRNSGFPTAVLAVGISFGLLCVFQAVLNVSLRLLSESDQPLDKDHVLQENEEMKEKIRQLIIRNKKLQDKNTNLTTETEILRTQMDDLRLTCMDSSVAPPSCPNGWTWLRSSCYQASNTTNTWDVAEQECERKGAHLVVLNGLEEEGAVAQLTGHVETWIGLRAEEYYFRAFMWTWVDGSTPTYNEWNGDVSQAGNNCVFLRNGPLLLEWLQDNCGSHHYWMCEREPK